MLNGILRNFPGLEEKCCRVITGKHKASPLGSVTMLLSVKKPIKMIRDGNPLFSNRQVELNDREMLSSVFTAKMAQ